MMTINNSAKPTAFSRTARSGCVNSCESALKAESNMRSQLMPAAAMSKASQATGDSVSASNVSVSAGTSDTISSASSAGMSAQAIAL